MTLQPHPKQSAQAVLTANKSNQSDLSAWEDRNDETGFSDVNGFSERAAKNAGGKPAFSELKDQVGRHQQTSLQVRRRRANRCDYGLASS